MWTLSGDQQGEDQRPLIDGQGHWTPPPASCSEEPISEVESVVGGIGMLPGCCRLCTACDGPLGGYD